MRAGHTDCALTLKLAANRRFRVSWVRLHSPEMLDPDIQVLSFGATR